MKVLSAFVFCLLSCLFAGAAFAGQVPEYDIKSLCAKVGDGVALITQQCLDDQRAARDSLKRMSYSEETLNQCRSDTEELEHSYLILEQCIKDLSFAKTLK